MASADSPDVHGLLHQSTTFRGKAFRVTSIYRSHHGENCFRVDVRGEPPCKFRIPSRENPLSVATEHAVLTLLHDRRLTWPQMIIEYSAGPKSYLITTFVEGESLDHAAVALRRNRFRDALERRLAEMHAIAGSHYGHLAAKPHHSWREFLDARFWSHVKRCARERVIAADTVNLIEHLYADATSEFAGVQSVLLHGDVKPANIIVSGKDGCCLIDFEISRFGDVDFEWVKMFWLSLRWPYYQAEIAKPLLTGRLPGFDVMRWPSKHILYAVYHVLAILSFERDINVPTPSYRLGDLRELIDILRSRYR